MKKILIVGRTFYPELSPRSFRTTELATELAKQGHDVTVILPQNRQKDIESKFENTFGIVFIYYGPLLWKSLGKSKISCIGDWKRKFGRLLFLLFEYPNIEIYFKLPALLKKLKGFDLLISIAVPHENHWAIAKVRTKKNPIAKVWVADCGDPFMTNVIETIKPPFYFGWWERLFLKKCDYVSVPTEGSVKAYNKRYIEKFIVIPQGFNFKDIQQIDVKPIYKVPTFAYAGGVSYTGIRSLNNFIDLLIEKKVPFKFHIYSNNAKTVLSEKIKGIEECIVIHDPLPRKYLLFELSKMDFLVNLDNGTPFNTPSKLIDYALTQRPILNINPLSPEALLVDEFLEGNYENQKEVSNLEDFNITNVATKFIQLIES
jgi:glycosyltransferase involved in cell wall biosynthesis